MASISKSISPRQKNLRTGACLPAGDFLVASHLAAAYAKRPAIGYMEFVRGHGVRGAKHTVRTAVIMIAGERHLDAGAAGLGDVDIDEFVFEINHPADRVIVASVAMAGIRDSAVFRRRAASLQRHRMRHVRARWRHCWRFETGRARS